MDKSNIQLTIKVDDPGLNPHQKEEMGRQLLQKMFELDEIKRADHVKVPNPPKGAQSIGGFLPGVVQAVVTPNLENIIKVLRSLINFSPNTLMEIEAERNGTKVKFKVRNLEDLEGAMLLLQPILSSVE